MVEEENALADLNLSKEVHEALMTGVKRRLTPQACKLRGRVEVQCFEYEGVEAVKRALMKGLSVSTPELEVKIKLVAPPQYVLLANCMEREDGLKVLDDAIRLIKEDMEAAGGTFTLRTKPEVVGDNDELGVGDLANKGDDSNSDSDGDSDESEEETMGFELTEDEIIKQTGGRRRRRRK